MAEARADATPSGQAEVLQTIIDALPGGVTLFDADLRMIACNEQFKRLLEFPATLFEGGLPTLRELAIFNARRGDYGPGDHELLAQQVVERARGMQAHVFERTRPNGTVLEIRGAPLPDGGGFVTIYTDITERKLVGQLDQFRSHTLELLAGGEPLPRVLESIVGGVEQLAAARRCSILLLDGEGKHLVLGSAPSLPDFYRAAIDGTAVGMGAACCGTAAFSGERVIVADIATHPDWAAYREPAAKAGLGACWSQPIRASSGRVLGTLAIYHRDPRTPAPSDLSLLEQSAHLASIAIERSLAADKIRESEALYRLLTEDVLDVVWKTDRDLRFTYISPADERLRGYRADEVIGHHVFELFTAEGIATVTELMQRRQAAEQRGVQTGSVRFEVQHRCKDGRLLWGEVFSTAERDAQGTITGYHGITRESTQRKQMEEQVRQLAFYDTLTNLPNRRLLNDRLGQVMAGSARSGAYAALMFIDLDNFKQLNDVHGHVVGDLLLIEAADRLRNCMRRMDTVARIGGDEFVVMLGELHGERAESASQAALVAEKIRLALSEPYALTIRAEGKADTGVEHRCTASIGVALFHDHETSQDDILKWADAAMYRAKEAGRNLIRFHDPQA